MAVIRRTLITRSSGGVRAGSSTIAPTTTERVSSHTGRPADDDEEHGFAVVNAASRGLFAMPGPGDGRFRAPDPPCECLSWTYD